jgi:hypothetical protein
MANPLEILIYSNLQINFKPQEARSSLQIVLSKIENFYYVGPGAPDISIACSPNPNLHTLNKVIEFNIESRKPGKVYCAIQDQQGIQYGFHVMQTYAQIKSPGEYAKGPLPPCQDYFNKWLKANGLKPK